MQKLVISDPFNAANSQTCNYSHDHLSRVDDVNCGTAWQQAFGFDAFGNITKTGSQSFTPTYSAATNRINGGGYSTSYDANGNQTADGLTLSSIGWNAENNPVSISNGTTTVSVVYDALGRTVENGSGSSYTEIVYGPDGGKLALMNGASLVKAFVALPGGGQAVYNSSGLAYYRHGDWLGSSRLATTPSRGLYFDGAYAPYGENYAGSGTTDLSFTGQNQDTISGLYDFMFRRYSPVQGRWISPDPAGMAAVDPSNPQTWNRYAYVMNNPMSFNDPTGLDCNNPTKDSPCVYTTVTVSADDTLPAWYTFVFEGGSFQSWSQMFCMVTGGCYSSQATSINGGGGSGGGASASAPSKGTPPTAANNGRNCTPKPANATQYAAATANVAALTFDFFSGAGDADQTFGPDSATSSVMAQSGPVQQVLDEYDMTGKTSGLLTFAAPGYASAGGNPVAQFVGSFRWNVTPASGGINLSLTNTTSFRSLTLDKGPQWQRGPIITNVTFTTPTAMLTPMGNIHQTYNISATCQ